MMGGFVDAMTRALMLGLAALATLAIMGSLVTMTGGGSPDRLWEQMRGGDETGQNSAGAMVTNGEEQENGVPANSTNADISGAQSGTIRTTPAPPPSAEERMARWLEVIAYVLMAMTALLAVIALVLMRSSQYWRAAAER